MQASDILYSYTDMHPDEDTPQQTPAREEPETSAPNKPKANSWWRSFFSSAAIIILAPLVAVFLTSFVFQSYEVQGASMESTLSNKDRLIILKLPATIAKIIDDKYIPKRYDIIVFNHSGLTDRSKGNKQLIKRVIGVPGDRVVVENGNITIYNIQSPQGFNPDVSQSFSANIVQPTSGSINLTVPIGEVFVCGDNRIDSHDSRDFGTVPSEAVIGKLVLRIMPISEFRSF
jgi:signal peptidase I